MTCSHRKHVHSDLASYVCTQEHCSHPLFESRHEWFDHEVEVHRKQWVCDLCGNVSPSTEEYLSHMRQRHQETFTRAQASEMASRAGHPVERIPAAACPRGGLEEKANLPNHWRAIQWACHDQTATIQKPLGAPS